MSFIKPVLLFLCLLLRAMASPAQMPDNLNRQIYGMLQQGNLQQATSMAELSAQLAKEKHGEQSVQYAESILILAKIYNKNRKANAPEPLYLRALQIIQTIRPDTDTLHICYLLGLADYYTDARQPEKADSIYLIAAQILEKGGIMHSRLYAIWLGGRGNLLFQQGLYKEAERLFIEAIRIEKENNAGDSNNYAVYTGMLGEVYLRQGIFDKAEKCLKESMALRLKQYGDRHLEYGDAVLGLAEFYGETGQFRKGLDLFTQAIGILKDALGTEHPDYALLMGKAADFSFSAGDNKSARILYQYSLDLAKNAFGETSLEYGAGLNGLALVMLKDKEYASARPYFEQAMEISKHIRGENDLDYAGSLNNLGLLYSGMGLYEKSVPYYKESLRILNTLHAWDIPGYLFCLTNLAKSYVYTGQFDKAEPLIISAAGQTIQNLRNIFPILSEKEKNNYLEHIDWMEQMSNSFLYSNSKMAKDLALSNFNFHLFAKSLALSDTRNVMEQVGNSEDSLLKRLFSEWKSSRAMLARQYALPAGNKMAGLAMLEAKTEELEKEMTRHSTALQGQQDALLISMKEVQKALAPDEAAIAFVRFSLYNREWTDSVMYAAYILRKMDSLPVFVPLCDERQLGKYFVAGAGENTIRAIYRSDPIDESDKPSISGDSLFSLTWKPMMPWLKGIRKIGYSPAGLFYKFAFHALPAGDSLLLMDRFELNQLTSLRQLTLNKDTSGGNNAIALFGDCEFDAVTTAICQDTRITENKELPNAIMTGQGLQKGGWKKLEGAAREINDIQALFKAKGISSNDYLQLRATEECFKAMSGHAPLILHLATHGFFLPDPQKRQEEGLAQDLRNAFTQAKDPLLRSGIVLTGANKAWNGQAPNKGREDGIVTAYEIAQLDLRQTDLVVLSACQTALGDIIGSEGVFGLQRAFKLAGVDKMILSLWKVPDAETAKLMNLLYTHYLKGNNARKSFMYAQQEMRRKYPPFYWAAFVLVE